MYHIIKKIIVILVCIINVDIVYAKKIHNYTNIIDNNVIDKSIVYRSMLIYKNKKYLVIVKDPPNWNTSVQLLIKTNNKKYFEYDWDGMDTRINKIRVDSLFDNSIYLYGIFFDGGGGADGKIWYAYKYLFIFDILNRKLMEKIKIQEANQDRDERAKVKYIDFNSDGYTDIEIIKEKERKKKIIFLINTKKGFKKKNNK